jgi:hypothetical protein
MNATCAEAKLISVTQPSRFAIQAETVCHPSSEGPNPSSTMWTSTSSAPSWNEIFTIKISTAVKSGHIRDAVLRETNEKSVWYGAMKLLVSRREDVIYYRIRIDVVYHDHIAKNCGNFERER